MFGTLRTSRAAEPRYWQPGAGAAPVFPTAIIPLPAIVSVPHSLFWRNMLSLPEDITAPVVFEKLRATLLAGIVSEPVMSAPRCWTP